MEQKNAPAIGESAFVSVGAEALEPPQENEAEIIALFAKAAG